MIKLIFFVVFFFKSKFEFVIVIKFYDVVIFGVGYQVIVVLGDCQVVWIF